MMDPHSVFTTREYRALELHLAEVLREPQLSDAMYAIATIFSQARREIGQGEGIEEQLSREFPHFSAMYEHAAALQQLLEQERPRWKTAGLDWAVFDASLAVIIDSAGCEASARHHIRGVGQKTKRWRDRLISVVYSVYPDGEAKISEGSHFEITIDMLLTFLGCPLRHAHKAISLALKRWPEPPFRIFSK